MRDHYAVSQLSDTLTIKKDVHLTKNLSSRYDMVIGTDLMKELGIQLDFSNDLIHMGTTQVSMTDIDALPSLRQSIRSFYGNRSHSSNARQGVRSQPKPGRPNLQRKSNKSASHADAQFSTGIEEPKSAAEAVERVSKILEAKYAPVTPEQILENSSHLTDEQKRLLKPILYKHIRLFDGTLGKWKGVQHRLELRDPKAPPFACRPYPVPVKNCWRYGVYEFIL